MATIPGRYGCGFLTRNLEIEHILDDYQSVDKQNEVFSFHSGMGYMVGANFYFYITLYRYIKYYHFGEMGKVYGSLPFIKKSFDINIR